MDRMPSGAHASWHGRKKRGPSKCNILWLRKAPKILKKLFYDGSELNIYQTYLWALLIGAIIGVVVVAYQKGLEKSIDLIWKDLKEKVIATGIFTEKFPAYNYNWMVATILGILVGLCLKIASKLNWLKTPGTLPDTIEKLHARGYISLNHFLPMFITSVLSITSGSSAGPEAAVLVLSGSVAGYIARQLMQSRITTRVLTLSGMSAGIAAFFGLPLGGALFVLEVPHRIGLQYYEALGPSIVATIISVIVAKSITREDLGGKYEFPPLPQQTYFSLFQGLLSGVIGAVAAVMFIFVARGFKYIKKITNLDPLLAGLIGGALIGALGVVCPYTMFPGENELQTILDRGTSPLTHAVTPGLIPIRWGALDFLLITLVKVLAIGITLGAGYPGGVIFPLFYTGASLGQAISLLTAQTSFPLPETTSVITMMAAIEAAVTRTPIGTCIIVLQIQKQLIEKYEYPNPTHYMALFPSLCVGVFVCLFLTQAFGLYDEQRDRNDAVFHLDEPSSLFDRDEDEKVEVVEDGFVNADIEGDETDHDDVAISKSH